MKNGIVFCETNVRQKKFEKHLTDLKITWPYKTAWIDSTQDISNFLLVFIEAQVNADDRRIDQTVDEYLPQLRDSLLAKLCQEIIPFTEYISRRNNLPSAVTIPLKNAFESLAPDNASSSRKKSGHEQFKTASDNEKEDEMTDMGMENEWKRVNVLFSSHN
jgi:hypothetical protein